MSSHGGAVTVRKTSPKVPLTSASLSSSAKSHGYANAPAAAIAHGTSPRRSPRGVQKSATPPSQRSPLVKERKSTRRSPRRSPLPKLGPVPLPSAGMSAAAAYAAFATGKEVGAVLHAFEALLAQTATSPDAGAEMLPTLHAALEPALPWAQKQLFASLSSRAALPQYFRADAKRACSGMQVVVVGAGPVGLRTAIEMALLGAGVRVLDARSTFSRLNVLHLWEWVQSDLVSLGLKKLDPAAFQNAAFVCLGTSRLQHLLLKFALLLGVRIDFGCQLNSLRDLADPSRGAPHLVVDATGARCPLFGSLGFEQLTVLKSGRALGLVCHLLNGRTARENNVEETSVATQYNQAAFGQLREAGVDLQNFVYYKSDGHFAQCASHYFVMTASADSLLTMGALRSADCAAGLCSAANVDCTILERYARRAVAQFKPELADNALVPGTVQIFDFSERKQSNRAAMAVAASTLGSLDDSERVVITRVGDALQEPFWPEGLGINRGFLHALDCADLAKGLAAVRAAGGHYRQRDGAGDSEVLAKLIARREGLFNCTKRIGGYNRKTELKAHGEGGALKYQIEPSTRYINLPKALPAQPGYPAAGPRAESC